MNILKTSICLLLLSVGLLAQNYNNEWINQEQDYYKITLNKQGLYRITYSALIQTEFPLEGDGFMLWHKGQEIPIYVSSTGTLDENDFIEFYGEANDGSIDAALFEQTGWQLSTDKSLYTDTSAYYLTWSNTVLTTQRYININNDLSSPPAAESYFWHTTLRTLNNQHNDGNNAIFDDVPNPDFAPCEGFVGTTIATGATVNYNLNSLSIYTDDTALTASLQTKIVGQSADPDLALDHIVEVSVNDNTLENISYDGFDCVTESYNLPLNYLIEPQSTISVTSVDDAGSINQNAVAYLELEYPHNFNFNNVPQFYFELANDTEKYLEISNFEGGNTAILLDMTNQLRMEVDFNAIDGNYRVYLPEPTNTSSSTRRIFISSTLTPFVLTNISSVTATNFTDYSNLNNQAGFVIISPKILADAAVQYAEYRSSFAGGNYRVRIAFIEDLYDQYSYGIGKHPLAIKNFIKDAVSNWTIPLEYVLLLGKGISYKESTYNPFAFDQNLLPSFGDVASDAMLATPDLASYIPDVAISRIPAKTNQEVVNYLNKLQAHDLTQFGNTCGLEQLWRKSVLNLYQADEDTDISNFTAYIEELTTYLNEGKLGAQSVGSFNNNALGGIAIPEINNAMTSGVGLINFVGNSYNGYWATDIQAPENYLNENLYLPFISSVSNNVAEMYGFSFSGVQSMLEDFVLAENAGCVAFWANTDTWYTNNLLTYNTAIYENLSNNNYGQAFLHTSQAVATQLAPEPSNENYYAYRYCVQTTTLAGDPAISLAPRLSPEFVIDEENSSFYNTGTNTPIFSDPLFVSSTMPEFEARIVVYNIGEVVTDEISINVTRLTPSGVFIDVLSQSFNAPLLNDTISLIIPNDVPEESGFNSFFFFIDADEIIEETCEFNNNYTVLTDMNAYCVFNFDEDVILVEESDFPVTLNIDTTYTSYAWSTGENGQSITVNMPGEYSVTVTNEFDCQATDDVTVSIVTGAASLAQDQRISIQPNPAKNFVQVKGISGASLQLYNSNGRLLSTKQLINTVQLIDTSQLPAGIYFLHITENSFTTVKKFIKQ